MERTDTATTNGIRVPGFDERLIGDVLRKVGERKWFWPLSRVGDPDRDSDTAVECVLRIGRTRDPNFTIDPTNLAVYTNILKWVNNDGSAVCVDPRTGEWGAPVRMTKGIYLAGTVGTGKTWCMETIRAYCEAVGRLVIPYDGKPHPLAWTDRHVRSICRDYQSTGSVDDLVREPVLCIQDLGSEPQDFMRMGMLNNPIQEIIERRSDLGGRITLFTSNLRLRTDKDSNLRQKYGDRVVSRLIGMCNYFELTGPDRR